MAGWKIQMDRVDGREPLPVFQTARYWIIIPSAASHMDAEGPDPGVGMTMGG